MKSPNNGETETKLAISCKKKKRNFQDWLWLHLIELLAKGALSEFPLMQAVSETIYCSLKSDSKTALLKTSATQLIEHVEVKLIFMQNLHPIF